MRPSNPILITISLLSLLPIPCVCLITDDTPTYTIPPSTPTLTSTTSANTIPTPPPLRNTTTLPSHYGILVFPSFQALDVFGPLDVLYSFALHYTTLPMHLSVIAATLDPVSTRVMNSASMNMTHYDFGQAIAVTDTLSSVLRRNGKAYVEPAPNPNRPPIIPNPITESCDRVSENDAQKEAKGMLLSDIEVLIVPGGAGTRRDLVEEIAFVKDMYPKLKYIVSVCTGATVLSRAGVLDGKRATSNKKAWAWVTSTSSSVKWIHTARWVSDGNIWTSSGISAGIDVTYAFLAHLVGEEVADFVALASEYERWRNATYDPFARVWGEESE